MARTTLSMGIHPVTAGGSSPARRVRGARLGAAVLLALFAAQAILSMRHKAVTVDEIMYIGVGYYHLQTGDFAMNMTNPPLMKMAAAAPLLLLGPRLPAMASGPRDWSLIEQWKFAREFLYHNTVDADAMLFTARLPMVALGVLLGVYVFRWSEALYGDSAALLALLFYSFSPNILAHARLATHDLGVTAFMFVGTYYFWRFMRQPGWGALLRCAACAGLAALTKTTAVFMAAVCGAYVLLCVVAGSGQGVFERLPGVGRLPADAVVRRQLLTAVMAFGVIGAVVVLVVNAGYGFQGTLAAWDAGAVAPLGSGVKARVTAELVRLPVPLPAPFVELVKFQSHLTASSGKVYFAGKLYESGRWYLMLAAFLLKTPIPALALLAIAGVGLARRWRSRLDECLPAGLIVVVMFVFSYLANINMGLRYVLPIYPCVHLLIGGLLRDGARRSRPALVGLAILAAWYVVGSLRVHPHYLAYFNESIGGPKNGYKYLVDSNLDWGQDLKGLKAYMDSRGIERVALGYFGSADADYYGIDYDFLPSVGLAPKEAGEHWWYEEGAACTAPVQLSSGIVAVSATLRVSPGWMDAVFGKCYARLDDREPIDQVGYSILIYRIDEAGTAGRPGR